MYACRAGMQREAEQGVKELMFVKVNKAKEKGLAPFGKSFPSRKSFLVADDYNVNIFFASFLFSSYSPVSLGFYFSFIKLFHNAFRDKPHLFYFKS